MNMLIYIVNKIFSIIARVVKWICNNWTFLRKVLVVLVLSGGLLYQFSLPESSEKINKSAISILLQREKKAISLKNTDNLSGAIDEYRQLITIITSQKKLSYLAIDDNFRYRVLKDTALLILDYSKSYNLTDIQQDMVPILLDELGTLQNKMDTGTELDKILRDLQKLKDQLER